MTPDPILTDARARMAARAAVQRISTWTQWFALPPRRRDHYASLGFYPNIASPETRDFREGSVHPDDPCRSSKGRR